MDASPSLSPNTQLRQERIGRNWRQQDLADQLGTTVVTVKRWERGSQQPSAYFRIKLCALFGKSAEELGLLTEEPPQEKNAPTKTSTPDATTQLGENAAGLHETTISSLHQKPLPAHAVTLEQQNRTRMLRLLRRMYQRAHDDALQGIAWMEMGLAEYPDAVCNATHLLQRLPDRTELALPNGTSIIAIYDQAEEELLILGAPGAGKSALLLDLAMQLVMRAECNEAHPFPVIVPLTSWAVTRPKLSDWLVEQLAHIYNVPRRLAQQWLQQGLLLPLLDGLDEMEEATRPLCIAAINRYRTEQVTPLVVCSRSDEYDMASTQQRLVLQNAVVVQPLTREQVDEAIRRGGSSLAALQEALTENLPLRQLSRTPLMLSVLLLAYQDTIIRDLPQHPTALEKRIWTDYVERMVRQKGAECQSRQDLPVKRYTLEQTGSWLGWLAQQMRIHSQIPFYAEYLQESWLPPNEQARWLVVRLPAMLLGTVISLLLSFLLLPGGDLADLCQFGLVGGFLGWCLSDDQRENTHTMTDPSQRSFGIRRYSMHPAYFLRVVLLTLLTTASFSLRLHPIFFYVNGSPYTMSARFRDGAITGGFLLVSEWLLSWRLAHMAPLPRHLLARLAIRWPLLFGWVQTMHIRRALWTGVILGFGMALSVGLLIGLTPSPMMTLHPTPPPPPVLMMRVMLFLGIFYGVSYAGIAFLISIILNTQARTVRLAERMQWTWRSLVRFHHLRTSLLVAFVCVCFLGLIAGVIDGLIFGLRSGLIFGLRSGLIFGPPTALTYWFLLGLYQGMTQHHLEDQDRRWFNQGIRRSLQNSSLFSLIGAGIITGIVVLLKGPYYWGLLLFCAWLVVWAATGGGLTILHHYLIRWILARSHRFPWHAQAFLDDATARILLLRVGGGYRFLHRRLLDYFADLDADLPLESVTMQANMREDSRIHDV